MICFQPQFAQAFRLDMPVRLTYVFAQAGLF